MNPRVFLVGLGLAGLTFSGCATATPAPGAGTAAAAATAPKDPWLALARDLTAEQVRAALGEPREMRPMQTSGGEIWVYRRTTAAGVDLVQTSTEEIPYYDPIRGEMRTRPSPVYSQQTRLVEQELNLLMFQGRLVSWKVQVRQGQRFIQ